MGQRQIRNKRQYLIQWKDYSPAHDSWEDESAIHAPLLIQAYQQRLESQSARQKPSISKRADKTRTKLSQPTPPSVTWSGRMSKLTSKAHSTSTQVLHIRTSEVEPIKLSPTQSFHAPLPSPSIRVQPLFLSSQILVTGRSKRS
jgi:Chromo (CHRromatin Organisation MOdifier) domain